MAAFAGALENVAEKSGGRLGKRMEYMVRISMHKGKPKAS